VTGFETGLITTLGLVAGSLILLAWSRHRDRTRVSGDTRPAAPEPNHEEMSTIRAENEVLSRLNRMQGEFVAVASHELKAPLTSIGAYTEVLQQHADESAFPENGQFLGIIKEESERLLRLVDRILDFSRLEFGQRLLTTCPTTLVSLIQETTCALEPLLARKQLALTIDCADDLPRVDVDRDLIKQALINLVNNAIKYTPEGGGVTVRVSEDAAAMRVTVSDTGPGIPAQELRTIFRQFYRLGGATAEEEGTGLGLAIVKNIINLHDGFVDVKSSEGEGAAFSFNLPKELRFDLRPEPWCAELHLQKQLQHILRLSLRMIAEMMEARQVTLLLLDQKHETPGTRAVLGDAPVWAVTETELVNSAITTEVLRQGKPLFAGVPEATADHDSRTPASVATRQWAVAPLRFDGSNHGLVWVGQKVDGAQFDTDDLDLLGVVCGRVAAVLAAVKQHTASPRMVNRVVDALQTLAMLKQTAIPTATPLALRLLARTATGLGMSRAEVKRLQYVASLHDAGMAQVDEDIRLKAGLLSEEERDEVIQHPERSVRLLEPILPVPEMGEIILAHHERMDGSGYPDGRQGGEIPLGARILAVLDTFFAMNNNRPYREGKLASEIAREIRDLAGTQFDPEVVDMFLAVLAEEGILTGDAVLPGGKTDPNTVPSGPKEKRCLPQGS